MRFLLPIVMLLLSACSNLPVAIKEAPSPDWQLSQVATQAEQHKGDSIRWGGQVVKVENDDNGSTIHVVQFPLNSFGRPDSDGVSQGRFLIHSDSFIDPYIYKAGTLITVAGIVKNKEPVTIDKKSMSLPVVTATQLYRWSKNDYSRDPYWRGHPYYYDPFAYGPYYGPGLRPSWRYYDGYYW